MIPDQGAAQTGTGAASVPRVRIRSHTISRTGKLTLELEVLAATPGQKIELRPQIDGHEVRDFKLAATRNLSVADQYTLTVPVPRGDFLVSVVATESGSASTPVQLRIHASEVDTRPQLFALVVGVGAYRDSDVPPLRYAGKDARDLVRVLEGQSDTVYRSVQTRLLAEQDATRAQIMEGLGWLKDVTGPDDTALLFFAGHGTTDADGGYFFLPQDSTIDHATMLAGTELQAALRGIRGKTVLLLDTCHSGGVMWRRSITRLINELVTENRLVVLAASTGDQVSRESPAWGNGAFTKALVEGLRGAADYAEDSRIMLSELETWVGVRVKELTEANQTPTLAKPNAAPDYVIAALPRKDALRSPGQRQRRHILFATIGAAIGAAVLAGVIGSRPWQGGNQVVDLAFKSTN